VPGGRRRHRRKQQFSLASKPAVAAAGFESDDEASRSRLVGLICASGLVAHYRVIDSSVNRSRHSDMTSLLTYSDRRPPTNCNVEVTMSSVHSASHPNYSRIKDTLIDTAVFHIARVMNHPFELLEEIVAD
jgi:hypothetical protein